MGEMMLGKRLFSQYIRPLVPIPTGIPKSGSLEKAIQCILFDVYGTLFISASGDIGTMSTVEQKAAGLKRLFREYHIQDPVDVVQRRMVRVIENQHARMKKDGVDYPEVQIEDIWLKAAEFKSREKAQKFALAYELINNPVFAMPHMETLLKTCHDKKMQMGIISNAQFYTPLLFQWLLGRELDDLGFNHDLLIFSYRFGYAKPSQFLFTMARERLEAHDISPGQVLYVGNDILNDITPAQKTGFHTALFAGDARSLRMREDDPRCAHTRPDLVITDLIQLIDYI
jgi:putative hydrolase of the HAD superfamily